MKSIILNYQGGTTHQDHLEAYDALRDLGMQPTGASRYNDGVSKFFFSKETNLPEQSLLVEMLMSRVNLKRVVTRGN